MKSFLALLPAILSAVVAAAHFLRAGLPPVVLLVLASPLGLLVRRPWVPRLAQAALLADVLLWVTTALEIARERQAAGAPWHRMAAILGGVAALALVAALIFETRGLRERYGRQAR